MHERHKDGYPRVRPNIRTYNAVIDSHAYNGRIAEAEDMLLSMVDNYESSAARSMDGIEDEELPIRPDSFSFNTVIQQWARSRTPEGGRRAEHVLDRMLKFHYDGNADVRPDERSFAYIIYHYTKGAGRMQPDAPDRALKLLRKMIGMYRQGYKELFLPTFSQPQTKTNPIFSFTSVVDAHSVLRRPDSGVVGEELLEEMTKLGDKIEALRPNTYSCLSVLYGWSSCGSVDAGERAT
jgi:pentatricopeptide repeat protein